MCVRDSFSRVRSVLCLSFFPSLYRRMLSCIGH
jgi:hypothetical protein